MRIARVREDSTSVNLYNLQFNDVQCTIYVLLNNFAIYRISRQAATITLTMTLTKLIATEDVASVDFFLNILSIDKSQMTIDNYLISSKYITCVYLLLYIIKNGIVAVGDDGL